MRLLVCGGRDFTDQTFADAALDRAHAHRRITLVIHGAARGADACADIWAKARGIPVMRFHADWACHGKTAGPIRNSDMLFSGRPDGVCAFPGGRGTADMVRQAVIAGLPVWRPTSTTPPQTRALPASTASTPTPAGPGTPASALIPKAPPRYQPHQPAGTDPE